MTNLERFLQDALKGGWSHRNWKMGDEYRVRDNTVQRAGNEYEEHSWYDLFEVESMLIDPLAFQAVGKVRGWELGGQACTSGDGCIEGNGSMHEGLCEWKDYKLDWFYHMHRMIDSLALGKTLEEAVPHE